MLSPVQVRGSTRYFDGWLADESARIRFVCFVPSKHAIFEEFARRGEAVSFSDVTIQKNKIGNAMEVLIQKSTPVLRSPQKIDVQTHLDAQPRVPRQIVLADIVRQVPMQFVDVKAKVVDVAEISKGANNSTSVRKVGIADETDAVIITLWGDDAEHVLAGKILQFSSVCQIRHGRVHVVHSQTGSPHDSYRTSPRRRAARIFPLGKKRNRHQRTDHRIVKLLLLFRLPRLQAWQGGPRREQSLFLPLLFVRRSLQDRLLRAPTERSAHGANVVGARNPAYCRCRCACKNLQEETRRRGRIRHRRRSAFQCDLHTFCTSVE